MKRTTMSSVLVVLTYSLSIFLCIWTIQGQSSCSVGDYNLTPLSLPNSAGTVFYSASFAGAGSEVYTLYWNICGGVSAEYCEQSSDPASCQTSSQFLETQWRCGATTDQTLQELTDSPSKGVTLTYGGGDVCAGMPGYPERQTVINIYCASGETTVNSITEDACVYTIEMQSPYACPGVTTLSPTPTRSVPPTPSFSPSATSSPIPVSPTPAPSVYYSGYNPCNSIKVTSFPSTFTENLQYGSAYNGTCISGNSTQSQFYLVRNSASGVVTASLCGLASFDSLIRVYQSELCNHLGNCIAYDDDGCLNSMQSVVSVSIVPNRDYYFEVRAYGTSPGGAYSIEFTYSS